MRQTAVELIRCPIVKIGVAALVVVKADPLDESLTKLDARVERMQVEVVVLEGPPQQFDEDDVLTATAAVHADGNPSVVEDLSERDAGKLCSLVRVEDLGGYLNGTQ